MTDAVQARVIAHSETADGLRLCSMQVTGHRFILAELNTHRVFSRNYRSSRAVPVKKLLEEVRTNPAMPVYWGANQPGMQAEAELAGAKREQAEALWRASAREAARAAECMADAGLHKQIANRVLEPFLYVHGLVSATEYMNFFGLRLDKHAQPEIRALAEAMWRAFNESKPKRLYSGQWHMPYIDDEDREAAEHQMEWPDHRGRLFISAIHGPAQCRLLLQSAARCARVSYRLFDADRKPSWDEDLAFARRLIENGHWSPLEHQATPDCRPTGEEWAYSYWHGNYWGWCQFRKMFVNEGRAPLPEGYR